MKTRIEEIWDDEVRDASTRRIDKDGLRLTRIDSDHRLDMYAGIDDGSLPVLAVRVMGRPPSVVMESRTFDCFRLQRADGSWLLVLRLRLHGFGSVFGRLCQDLVDATERTANDDELVALFLSRLRLWERLFLGNEDGLLAPRQIRGLIAELTILQHVATAGKRDLQQAVEGWIGPLDAEQDFVYSDVGIEVKAVSAGRKTLTVSSLGQLECPVPLCLALVVLESAAPRAQGARSLNSTVATVEGIVSASAVALATFKDRLLSAGYVDHPRYDEDWFVPSKATSFAVSDEFPKLSRSSVPAGVVAATYDLEIEQLERFKRTALPD